MKYIDKNLIIERYTNGSMNPAEIQDFHTMLETDSELRALFHAENVINSAMNGERTMLASVDHSHTYARFLKTLADSVPQAAVATAGAAGTGKAASWLAGVSTSVKLTVSACLLAGGVTAGAVWLNHSAATTPAVQQEQQIQQPALSAPTVAPETPAAQPSTQPLPTIGVEPRSSQAKPNSTTTPRAATDIRTREKQEQTVDATEQQIPIFPADSIPVNVQGNGKRKK
jgi:hypothetical protein